MSKYRGIIKTVLIVFIIRTVLSIAVNGFSIENIAYDFLICLLILFFAILFFKLGYNMPKLTYLISTIFSDLRMATIWEKCNRWKKITQHFQIKIPKTATKMTVIILSLWKQMLSNTKKAPQARRCLFLLLIIIIFITTLYFLVFYLKKK